MKRNLQVEATLERSLRKQVKVRRLDESFDAAVWARIEAEEAKAAAPTPLRTAATSKTDRWFFVVNALGVASAAVVVCVFLFRWLAGIELEGALPNLAPLMTERNESIWSTGIAGAVLLFGFMFTPWGRRLRDEFL